MMTSQAQLRKWARISQLTGVGFATLAIVTSMTVAPAFAASSTFSTSKWDSALGRVVHADVTQSVALPSGRILWVFGDTTEVNGRSTVHGFGYPHGSFVTQARGTLAFKAVPGKYGFGWQQVPNWSDGTFFWMSTPIVDRGVLYVLGERIKAERSSFSVVGQYVAEFNVKTLAYKRIIAVPKGKTGKTTWGGVAKGTHGWWLNHQP